MAKREMLGAFGAAAFGLMSQNINAESDTEKDSTTQSIPHETAHQTHLHAPHHILHAEHTADHEAAPSIAQHITIDHLGDENAELTTLFDKDPDVSEKYFDLIDHLSTTVSPDGDTRFTVPGTDFDLTLRIANEDGKSWIACEGTGCADYGESMVDGKTQLTQVGWMTQIGPSTDSAEGALNSPAAIQDFQHLLAGYARADVYGAHNPMADADTSSDDEG